MYIINWIYNFKYREQVKASNISASLIQWTSSIYKTMIERIKYLKLNCNWTVIKMLIYNYD